MGQNFSRKAYNLKQNLVPLLNRALKQRDALTAKEMTRIAESRLKEAKAKGMDYTDPNALISGFTRGRDQLRAIDEAAAKDPTLRAAAESVPEIDSALLDFMSKHPVTQKYNTTLAVSADENSPPYDREAAIARRRSKTVQGKAGRMEARPLPTNRTSNKEPVKEKAFEVGSSVVTGGMVRDLLLEHQATNPSKADVVKLATLYNLPEDDVRTLLTGMGVPIINVDPKDFDVSGEWYDIEKV
jgi:hypothetical protein